MNDLDMDSLGALGLTLPTPAYLIGAVIFGLIGLAAFRYGKKTSRPYPKWIGAGLMLYPYAISQTGLLYAVGIGLCVALYFFRD